MRTVREKVVVIGAGLGGLAAALCLAHAGLEVTVVDRLDAPGGKMRSRASVAGPIDAGPTVLTLRGVFDALFDAVGARLSDHVTLIAEPVLARHWWPDGDGLDLYADAEASEAAIRDFSGGRSAAAFRRFNRRSARLFDAFDAPMMRDPAPNPRRLAAVVARAPSLLPDMAAFGSLAGMLGREFADPRLAQLFGRYATYVGGSPYRSPALLALIWQAEARGVWRVAGGMHRLALAMAALAAAKGARFHYGAEALGIEFAGGGAAVRLVDGRRLPAGRIVFNGDPRALATGLLGAAPARAVPTAGVEPRSLSAYVWSFAAPPPAARLIHHNVFFGRTPRAEFDDLDRGRAPRDPTLYVCAQDRGAGAGPGAGPCGLERFEIIQNGPPVTRGRPPAEEFETCAERTFRTLSRMGLSFASPPERRGLTTPRDFATLFPGSAGSLYGRSPHGLMAAFRRCQARTAIPELYLAGGGVHPGPGVPMATLSGRHAAAAILADLASTSMSRRMAMPGGTSTDCPTTTAAPSRSSVS